MLHTEELKKLAKLARVDVTSAELVDLEKSLGDILNYVSEIQTVSSSAEKGGNMASSSFLKNIMREDVNPHDSSKHTEDLLRAAPNKERGHVRVKKFFS